MKIAIIGSGHVGGTLGRRWAQRGHEIIFGLRDPNKNSTNELLKEIGPRARAASVAEAAAAANLIVLATPWQAAQNALAAAGNLAGKIVIDCTNPVKDDLTGLSIGLTTSAAEQVSLWAKGAAVVKAFNMTGSGNMVQPQFGADRATMFICGDDTQAKQAAGGLAAELGFDVVDAGGLIAARYLEPLAMLWIHLAYSVGLGPNIAFRLIRR